MNTYIEDERISYEDADAVELTQQWEEADDVELQADTEEVETDLAHHEEVPADEGEVQQHVEAESTQPDDTAGMEEEATEGFERPVLAPAEAMSKALIAKAMAGASVSKGNASEGYVNPGDPAVARALIYVKAGEMAETLSAIEAVLAASGRYFHRGGQIVEVRASSDHEGVDLRVMTPDSLVVVLSSLSQWFRQDKRGDWLAIDPVERYCKLLLNGGTYAHLKPLTGIASQPHIRMDGSVCLVPGYDPTTGIFSVFDNSNLQETAPSREAALEALAVLKDLVAEVAFVAPRDEAAALAAILTAAVRPSLAQAPMFHVAAHQPGSGKSFLCQLIGAFASPKPSSQATFPSSNEECGKLLLAQLMRSPAVVEFDNVVADIKPYATLCSALTGEQLEGRVLGTSSTAALSTRTLFLSSGNNVRPVGDMIRRTVVINLDPRVETPSSRQFARPDLLAELRRDRTRYVTAALTVVQAWIASGAKGVTCPPLGNFGDWSRWCRESLIWLGLEDPVASLMEGLATDPEKELLGRVLQGWHARFNNTVVMVRQIVASASVLDEDDDFRDALIEVSGGAVSINVRKLGHWLAHKEGQIVSGLRLVKAPKTRSAQNWRVEEVA